MFEYFVRYGNFEHLIDQLYWRLLYRSYVLKSIHCQAYNTHIAILSLNIFIVIGKNFENIFGYPQWKIFRFNKILLLLSFVEKE